MPTTDDEELFESRWNEHIEELRKIGLSLPAEHIPKLNETIDDLEELVEVAADNVGDNNDQD